jgi:hypothetical protein
LYVSQGEAQPRFDFQDDWTVDGTLVAHVETLGCDTPPTSTLLPAQHRQNEGRRDLCLILASRLGLQRSIFASERQGNILPYNNT